MNKIENSTTTPTGEPLQTAAAKSTQHVDYAAWVDSEGREHPITSDMVNEMISELVASGPDYSLQGRWPAFNPQGKTVRYSQSLPRLGE